MAEPPFQYRDPSRPEFWTERFACNFTPWDCGGVPQALQRFVAQSTRSHVALIPGCGTGHEVAYLSDAGWQVMAIDFSPAAVATAQAGLGKWAVRIIQADFFTFMPPQPVELIYERAFLCALPREKWPSVVERWAELLPPGGLLAGFFFFDDLQKGPPFGANRGELLSMMQPCFEQLDDQPVADSLPVFAGRERWQIWRRRAC